MMNVFAQDSQSDDSMKSDGPRQRSNAAIAASTVLPPYQDAPTAGVEDHPWTPTRTHRPNRARTRLPLSMQILRPLMSCQDCGADWPPQGAIDLTDVRFVKGDESGEMNAHDKYNEIYASLDPTEEILKPHIVAPMMLPTLYCTPTTQTLLQDYLHACQLYSTPPNSGVLTTIRFALPALRVAGPFHDADMLALGEVLARHLNGPLSYVRRLDFSRASSEGKSYGRRGFRSHGALCLAKILTVSQHVEEVRLQRHRIGPYGAAVLFMAAIKNPVLKSISLRRCRLGERGGLAFAEIVCPSIECGLREVDLSANRIGFRGCLAIEQAMLKRHPETHPFLDLNLDGNLVFQEVMNGVTHGLGIILAMVGSALLYHRTKNMPTTSFAACLVYSASLLLLYTSSTLYHSFFTMLNTKFVFEALDKCAIYILIAGSYTPFLQIALGHIRIWSVWLLLFIWICCFFGIYVQATLPDWKHKGRFSLLMYLGMGWACVMSLHDLMVALPPRAIHLMALGGLAYTGGVPFFVRNNNLDHSIWHLFVMAGSIFHWLAIYIYVVPPMSSTEQNLVCDMK